MTPQVAVRAFAATDRKALLALFTDAGLGSPTGSLWGHPASEAAVYLDPYADHEAGTLVLATAGERAVGYLAGCVDSTRFPSEDERLARAVREHRLIRRRVPMTFFARSLADLARARVHRQPVAGELVENARAAAFFERQGFRRYGPAPVVPGVRVDGRRAHQLTMTISLLPETSRPVTAASGGPAG
ncbi:MAG: hypothetical protein ACRCZD_21390 [Phycicoccus sp.]